MASALNAAAQVRDRIARAMLAPSARVQVGAFTLRAGQRRTLHAVREALRRHGGALVADAPGTGKTVLAHAVAQAYGDALVIAPAALREQWTRSAAQAALPLRFVSLEQLSAGHCPARAALLIVDEAHHVRTPGTRRYRAVAALARQAHILLLTASPVVNRVADRDALLALFLGETSPDDALRGRWSTARDEVVIRRTTQVSAQRRLRYLPDLPTRADVPGLAEAIAALPAPFPAADGRDAQPIVRLGLAMAWSSSLAALHRALGRRAERSRSLLAMLREGRWPSRTALARFVLGDDATQLALDLALPDVQGGVPSGAVAQMAAHLAAIEALRDRLQPLVQPDVAIRATGVEALVRGRAPLRAVLLAQQVETVRQLYAALRHRLQTVAITGDQVRAAAGRWTRDDVLRRLGPNAPPWRPDDATGIQLLLASDLLAEGVELQGAATLVHGDLPWTPARIEQREGRLLRDGQREEVQVASFARPAGAERLLALEPRLQAKRGARREALAAAEASATLQAALEAWRLPRSVAVATVAVPTRGDDGRGSGSPTVAAVAATFAGFIAVLRHGGHAQLVGAVHRRGRWRIRSDPAWLRALVRRADGMSIAWPAAAAHTARRLLGQWWRRQRGSAVAAAGDHKRQPLMTQLRRRLDATLASTDLAARHALALHHARLLGDVQRQRGAGLVTALRDIVACTDDRALLARLEALCETRPPTEPVDGRVRLHALLLLVPR